MVRKTFNGVHNFILFFLFSEDIQNVILCKKVITILERHIHTHKNFNWYHRMAGLCDEMAIQDLKH